MNLHDLNVYNSNIMVLEAKKLVRSALGRGLGSLISEQLKSVPVESPRIIPVDRPVGATNTLKNSIEITAIEENTEGINYIDITKIQANPNQPRQQFSEAELLELAESIKEHGLIQPVVVRKLGDVYEIIAGERRYRASKLLKFTKLPVIIKDFDDRTALEVSIIENIQRENLNPIDEANAYKRLANEFGLSQEEIAKRVSKGRASVSNTLRLLTLSEEIVDLIKENKISLGHAKAILTIKDPKAQNTLAKKIISEGLSVRAVEALVGNMVVLDSGQRSNKTQRKIKVRGKANIFADIIERLRGTLGTKVGVRPMGKDGAVISIHCFTNEELDRVVQALEKTATSL